SSTARRRSNPVRLENPTLHRPARRGWPHHAPVDLEKALRNQESEEGIGDAERKRQGPYEVDPPVAVSLETCLWKRDPIDPKHGAVGVAGGVAETGQRRADADRYDHR